MHDTKMQNKGIEPPPAHSLILEELEKGFQTSDQDNKVRPAADMREGTPQGLGWAAALRVENCTLRVENCELRFFVRVYLSTTTHEAVFLLLLWLGHILRWLRGVRVGSPPGLCDTAFCLQVLQRIFERIDYKKDNKIDREELEHTLKSLGSCRPSEANH
jgi:hypothetical protein